MSQNADRCQIPKLANQAKNNNQNQTGCSLQPTGQPLLLTARSERSQAKCSARFHAWRQGYERIQFPTEMVSRRYQTYAIMAKKSSFPSLN